MEGEIRVTKWCSSTALLPKWNAKELDGELKSKKKKKKKSAKATRGFQEFKAIISIMFIQIGHDIL